MNPEKSPRPQPSSTHARSGVYFATGLQKDEKVALHKRSPKVLEALKKLNIQADRAPVIAVLGSGGGLRAHIAFLGVLSKMKELGLLDAVTYLAGVSGSTWALSSFYIKNGNMDGMEEELTRRYEHVSWNFGASWERVLQAARRKYYSLTDFWAYMVVSRQTRELQDSNLSSIKKQAEEGLLPYPIFAAIDEDLQHVSERKTRKSWFEFTPHHAGYPALDAYVPITEFGSRFENGKLVGSESERDLSFLRGLWGSALADMEENKKFIWDSLFGPDAEWKKKRQSLGCIGAGALPNTEAPGTTAEDALLDLVATYVKDQKDPGIMDKFQALQQALGAERGDSGEQELGWLAEVSQNWSEISPEKQQQFLEYLLNCFMKTRGPATQKPASFWSVSWDIFTLLGKTAICLWNWEWGTVYNFLYKLEKIKDEDINNWEFLHLVDAGLAINTPYPLVLPPVRKTDLILSFDFSAGDPLETIRAAADYCQRHKIPFPEVKEEDLKKWSAAPDSCYVLSGKTGPTVMHFTLFNKDNCGGDIEKWRQNYKTMKLSDSYTPCLVADLLRVSKKNVQINLSNILSEFGKVTRKPVNLAKTVQGVQASRTVQIKIFNHTKITFKHPLKPVNLAKTVQGVQASRTVQIKIFNHTKITFKHPLHYLQSGLVLLDPPTVLSPNSTISCSFVNSSSSFEGTVGLLVYQGPNVHLALMFSVPFNYALHSIEFAVAIITEPVYRDLKSIFDNIIQGKGSPEVKVAKSVLLMPQRSLKLEHHHLIIRATMCNIHVARMNVVVETKAP